MRKSSIFSFCVIFAVTLIGYAMQAERRTDIGFFRNPKSPRTKDFLDKILI